MAQVGILSNNQWPAPFDGSMYSNSGRNLKTWWNFEEFISGPDGATIGYWRSTLAGVGASVAGFPGTNVRPGILECSTGTTAAGRAGAYSAGVGGTLDAFLLGGGSYAIEGDFYIVDLSTVAEEFVFCFGIGDTVNIDMVDGAYFYYDRLNAGVNWRLKAASNSARTDTDSTVAVTAGAWTRLKVVVNPTGTAVNYYINGTLVGTVTTNIPTGAGRNSSAIMNITKTAGLTGRIFRADWVWLHIDLTASR